jgi:ABC-type siderophore export system fused ATPase/permease subunit
MLKSIRFLKTTRKYVRRVMAVSCVMVPVLSNTITLVLHSRSIASPLYTMMFCLAALFITLTIATAVENIRGHGVATSSTERIV